MRLTYHPPQEIIEKYAKLLVHFGVGGGKGLKKGETVRVVAGEASRPLYLELVKEIWRSGGHVLGAYSPDTYRESDNLDRYFFEVANESQLTHYKKHHAAGLAKEIDHQIAIIADTNLQELKGVDPAKVMKSSSANKPFGDLLTEKENKGKFTWTLGLYGTKAMAAEAGLSQRSYWQQIIKACYLDYGDPVVVWKDLQKKAQKVAAKLDAIEIEWVEMAGRDCEIKLKIGKNRKWRTIDGRNLPSFEIFTSPDWRGTEGWIKFNQPLYRYGNIIEGVELKFAKGKVTQATARKGEKVLKEMIATKNADRVGEFSLTDKRFSRITHFMAETLFDENMGGKFGNTHLALGASYRDCYKGKIARVKKADWAKMGYNDSVVHTDIVSTTDRTVTAVLKGGKRKVIYQGGQFTV